LRNLSGEVKFRAENKPKHLFDLRPEIEPSHICERVTPAIRGKPTSWIIAQKGANQMKKTDADTVEEYLAELPKERRQEMETVRQVVLENLPDGYEEALNWGMIAYQVPLETYPDTYNGQPLMYAALASQKNHMSLYLTAIYMDEDARKEFEAAYKATGKRYDAAKSCVRFRTVDDLPLPLIAETIASLEVDEFIQKMKAMRS
jgi:uncharacterized protein YdhG (YjbR/CyaY superfamily)